MNTRIKELCRAADVTTAYQLQKLCDISPSQATRLFNDKVEAISLSVLKTLCNSLKCSPNDLFGYDVASASVPELSKPQSAPVSNAKDVHRRLKKLSSGNVKSSDGSLVVSDTVASDNEKLLSTAECAERIGGVSERTVSDYYVGKSGGVKLVSVKVGTKRFVSESDLNDFIARRGKK
jgi:DNA-binding Xre family transcriptional regulator